VDKRRATAGRKACCSLLRSSGAGRTWPGSPSAQPATGWARAAHNLLMDLNDRVPVPISDPGLGQQGHRCVRRRVRRRSIRRVGRQGQWRQAAVNRLISSLYAASQHTPTSGTALPSQTSACPSPVVAYQATERAAIVQSDVAVIAVLHVMAAPGSERGTAAVVIPPARAASTARPTGALCATRPAGQSGRCRWT